MDGRSTNYLLVEEIYIGEDGKNGMLELSLMLSGTRAGNKTRIIPYLTRIITSSTKDRMVLAGPMAAPATVIT